MRIALCLALLAALVLCCPSSSQVTTLTPTVAQPTVTPQLASVGQRVESAGVALTINAVRIEAALDVWEPDEGHVFLIVEVIIENAGRDEPMPYNPLYCKVKDGDGFEYTTSVAGTDRSLKSGELTRGEKVRGEVVFEVPEGVGGFVFVYEPLVIFGGYEPIRVGLGR